MDEAFDLLTDYDLAVVESQEPEFITDLVIVKIPSYIDNSQTER